MVEKKVVSIHFSNSRTKKVMEGPAASSRMVDPDIFFPHYNSSSIAFRVKYISEPGPAAMVEKRKKHKNNDDQ